MVLDLLLDRAPHSSAATAIFANAERGVWTLAVCATTVTTVFYLAAKAAGAVEARRLVERLLRLVEIAPVTRTVLEEALDSPLKDYEDAVVAEAGRHAGCGAVITRNVRDYKSSRLRAYSPEEWLQR